MADLENRVMLLEARLRRAVAEVKAANAPPSERPRVIRAERARPRCPGCLLELPRGRRGETCVWCGFVFAAVEQPLSKITKRRRPAAAKGVRQR